MIKTGKGIRYIVPQQINNYGIVNFNLRIDKPRKSATIHINAGDIEIFKKKLPWANPANMIELKVDVNKDILKSKKNLEVFIDDR